MKTGNADGIEEKDFFGRVSSPRKVITRKPVNLHKKRLKRTRGQEAPNSGWRNWPDSKNINPHNRTFSHFPIFHTSLHKLSKLSRHMAETKSKGTDNFKKKNTQKRQSPTWISDIRSGRSLSVEFFKEKRVALMVFLVAILSLMGLRYKTKTKMEEIKRLTAELQRAEKPKLRGKGGLYVAH